MSINSSVLLFLQLDNGGVLGQLEPGSPATSAGVQPRDAIKIRDDLRLKRDSALAEAIDAHEPGDTIALTALWSGQLQSLRATLGEMPGPSA